MGIQQDPIQVCGHPFPVSFLQMLLSTLMVNADGDIVGFNFTVYCEERQNCDCEPYINCNNNHVPYETLLVQGFGLDACGHLAIKLINCDGTADCLGGELQ